MCCTEINTGQWTFNKLISVRCGSPVVSVLDSGTEGPGFKSQPRHCRVTVLGKLFTPIVPLLSLSSEISRFAGVTAGLAESNDSLPPGL